MAEQRFTARAVSELLSQQRKSWSMYGGQAVSVVTQLASRDWLACRLPMRVGIYRPKCVQAHDKDAALTLRTHPPVRMRDGLTVEVCDWATALLSESLRRRGWTVSDCAELDCLFVTGRVRSVCAG